jgi:hypothetical protein
MGYELLASVVIIYGFLITVIFKLPKFILKLEDSNIDKIVANFNEHIIKNTLNLLVTKKQNSTLRNEDINELRDILDVPVEIDSIRKDTDRGGVHSLVAVIICVIAASLNSTFPTFEIGDLPFLALTIILNMVFIAILFGYLSNLIGLKKEIAKAKSRILNKQLI